MNPTARPERLTDLMALPGVADAVAAARASCEELRWHPALRRRIPEAAAESRVRGATASAALEGAEVAGTRLSLPLVRDVMRGAQKAPAQPDPVWRTLMAAVQVTAAGEEVNTRALAAPVQVLSRLHVAAGTPLLPAVQVGRPRLDSEACGEWTELGSPPSQVEMRQRLTGIADLLTAVRGGEAPVLLLAALVHAELVATRPFVAGNALVARSLERIVLQLGGLDPTGVAVIEAGHAAANGTAYRGAMTAYVQGGSGGVGLWLVHCAEAVVEGAAVGRSIADAVLAGRLG
ncbi:MAG: hypothetical protein WA966_10475 [Ornithinimicrobium sp.]